MGVDLNWMRPPACILSWSSSFELDFEPPLKEADRLGVEFPLL